MVSACFVDLGVTDYMKALAVQHELVSLREKNSIPDIVLLTEHEPCILFGRDEKKNSFSPEFLQLLKKENTTAEEYLVKMGVSFYPGLKYGGGASYIGPGQLVVYPIVKYTRLLEPHDIGGYKKLIDKTMLQVMHDFGISSAYIAEGYSDEFSRERRDVWVDVEGKSHKIAAKGVYLGREIASHGFQIYAKQEGTKHFDLINPCGYARNQVWVVSMEEVAGKEISLDDVKRSVVASVKENFGYESLLPCSLKDVIELAEMPF